MKTLSTLGERLSSLTTKLERDHEHGADHLSTLAHLLEESMISTRTSLESVLADVLSQLARIVDEQRLVAEGSRVELSRVRTEVWAV